MYGVFGYFGFFCYICSFRYDVCSGCVVIEIGVVLGVGIYGKVFWLVRFVYSKCGCWGESESDRKIKGFNCFYINF